MKSVMVFGTFDIVHPGHLFLFREAKKHGDRLIVVVARDATVKKVKAKVPWYTERERKAFLEELRLVDTVVLGDKKNRYAMIRKFRPDVIVLGYDQEAFIDGLEEKIDSLKLKTQIIRLRSHKRLRYKSTHIKTHLLSHV